MLFAAVRSVRVGGTVGAGRQYGRYGKKFSGFSKSFGPDFWDFWRVLEVLEGLERSGRPVRKNSTKFRVNPSSWDRVMTNKLKINK